MDTPAAPLSPARAPRFAACPSSPAPSVRAPLHSSQPCAALRTRSYLCAAQLMKRKDFMELQKKKAAAMQDAYPFRFAEMWMGASAGADQGCASPCRSALAFGALLLTQMPPDLHHPPPQWTRRGTSISCGPS